MAAKNGAIKLVAGNSNRALSEAIGAYLQTPLTKAEVRRFADQLMDIGAAATAGVPNTDPVQAGRLQDAEAASTAISGRCQ